MGNPRQLAASLRLTRMLQGRYGIATRNVIGHNENRSSPFHRERVARLRTQTHADFPKPAMDGYRRLLERLPAPGQPALRGRVTPAGDAGSPRAPQGCAVVAPTGYEIRIKGRLSDSLSGAFEDFTASVRPAETVMRGELRDQSELHGVLDRIQSLGLELIEVRRLRRPD